jgi:hypothetical protein
MKTPELIITRDKDGDLMLWSSNAQLAMGRDGNWYSSGGYPSFRTKGPIPAHFKIQFGFLPRKGSKTVYELKELKP